MDQENQGEKRLYRSISPCRSASRLICKYNPIVLPLLLTIEVKVAISSTKSEIWAIGLELGKGSQFPSAEEQNKF